jgi:predicted ester cyclase
MSAKTIPARSDGGVRQVTLRDITSIMEPQAERRQNLAGFEPVYADFVDYIIRCTHRIWDERGVGLIDTHYTHNPTVYTPYGTLHSREEMVASTLRTLAGWSDRRGYGNEVIWSGDDQRGLYSSHRVTSVGRNTGWTEFGPPTRRKVSWITVADCAVIDNRIYEEWIVRDYLAVVLQLGHDPREAAKKIAAAKAAKGESLCDLGDIDRLRGQFPAPDTWSGPATDEPTENLVCQFLHDVWNRRRMDKIFEVYAPHAATHVPPMRTIIGREAYFGYVVSMLAMMSNAGLMIQHVCSASDPRGGRQVAVRWLLDGHHDGPGRLGDPTGKRLSQMGVSHIHVQDGRIVEHWKVTDEFSLMVQLAMPG